MRNVDPILVLLAWLILICLGAMIFVTWLFHDDGQIFQVVSGLLTGFAGGFLLRVKPSSQKADAQVEGGTETSSTITKTVSSSEDKPNAPAL